MTSMGCSEGQRIPTHTHTDIGLVLRRGQCRRANLTVSSPGKWERVSSQLIQHEWTPPLAPFIANWTDAPCP